MSIGSSPVESLMWIRQVDDYSQFMYPSLVYHQELDLCRSSQGALQSAQIRPRQRHHLC
jgi:hypothetical protein